MDISGFFNDNFNTSQWVNEILKNGTAHEKKENYTMSLVMKLQLYVQQINNALEETSQQVLISLPKIIRDVKNLHQEAAILKEKMSSVREEIIKIELDTGKSINTIEKLDKIKSDLCVAKQSLHESDNWNVLANDLEEVFDSENIEKINSIIVNMERSLKLLMNVADFEDRKLQLEGFKNRLEAIVSPAIVQAFTTNNSDQSIYYVEIFKSIGRLSQLLKYYHKCQKDILLKKWQNQLEIEQDEIVTQWMNNFYNYLIIHWNTQQKWFNQIFTINLSSYECLCDIYIDVLNSLNPNLNECIDSLLKQTDDKLSLLLEIKQINIRFGNNFLNYFDDGKIHKEKFLKFQQTIHYHFIVYVNKYPNYEQNYLLKQLSLINCIKDELPNTIQALGLSIPSIIDLAREATKHCYQITENCSYCGLLNVLRIFFLKYADQYRVALRQIDRNKKFEEDWNNFQLCLSLLQNTGDILLKLQQFEKDLTSTILNFNQKSNNIDYKLLFLDFNGQKELESLIKCVTEGIKLSLLDHVIGEFNKLCVDIHTTTYQTVFTPISTLLDIVQSTKIWSQFSNTINSDLPDYSFTPQEYITQIGQYLLTLPQHLEPFLFKENPPLNCALKIVDQKYCIDNINNPNEGAMAHVFLKIIANGTCQVFCEQILSIRELNQTASRQLAHDIGYLENVFNDLGITLNDNLKQLKILLKLPAEQYYSQSSGCSARYVAAVRQMRNITTSN